MYHLVAPKIPAGFLKYTVTLKAFSAQMSWLRIAGYQPITLDGWLGIRRGSNTPSRPVIITFDDGFQECLTYAVPILRAHRFPAIFFIVAGLVGKTSRWMADELKLELPLMNWGALAELSALGFECGSHSATHPHLTDLSIDDCRRELSYSRSLLEQHLGCKIRHLAYPYGSYNDTVRDLAQASGYISACTVRTGLSTASDDLMALRRVPVNGQESLLDFACRVFRGSCTSELMVRALRRLCRSLKLVGSATNP